MAKRRRKVPLAELRHMTIKLVTPMPCGTVGAAPGSICGQPALAATADRLNGGEWVILPICEAHTKALLSVYFPAPDE